MDLLQETWAAVLGGVFAVLFPWYTFRALGRGDHSRAGSRLMGLTAAAVALVSLLAVGYHPLIGFGVMLVTAAILIAISIMTRPEHVGPLLGDASEPVELIAEAQRHMRSQGMEGDLLDRPVHSKPIIVTPDDAQTVDEWLEGAHSADDSEPPTGPTDAPPAVS